MDLQLNPGPSSLPIGQLESLRFKISQIIDAIQNLQRSVEFGLQVGTTMNTNMMQPWPEILSKYNLLVSQTHTLSSSLSTLVQSNPTTTTASSRVKPIATNPFEKLALHPSLPLTDSQLDNEIVPLLRNQQTTQVLNLENELVHRIRNSSLANGSTAISKPMSGSQNRSHEQTLRDCEAVRADHDARVERAVRAVTMLRDRYDWKARVEISFPVTPPPEHDRMVVDETQASTPDDMRDEDTNASSSSGDEVGPEEDAAVEQIPQIITEDIIDAESPQSGIFTPTTT